MPERTLFEDERQLDRPAIADYLRSVADRLDDDGSVTFETGADDITVEVPATVEFEVKVEREGPADGPGELGLELELEWPEDAALDESDAGLSVR
jgi:amphi-Trp domain-containing protein